LEDMLGPQSASFEPIPTLEPNFGYIDSRVWLRLRAENISESHTDWRIYVRENFLQYYDVYIVRSSGMIEQIEQHDPDTVFSQRSTAYPELVSPFKLASGERVTIFVSYWSGGSSHAALSLETAESFADIAVNRTSKNYTSYGMMMILIVTALLALIILKKSVFLAYLGYVVTTLIYLMHGDGVAFQFFWPNFPHFNSYFSIVIGTLFILVTYNFARVFLETKQYHPKIDKILAVLSMSSLIIVVILAFIDPQFTKRFLHVLVFLGITAGTLAGCVAAMTRFRQVRFYLIAWVCGVISAGLMNLRHNFGFEITQDIEFDSIRVSIVVDAIMMGLGVADRYRQIVRSRQKSAQDNLETAQHNLRLRDRLYDLEEQYRLAVELVQSRDTQMRDTVHDLRQPLHALRLNLQNLEDGKVASPTDKSSINSTFAYLENLIASHLKDTVIDPVDVISETETEGLDVPDILTSIYDMFLPDAQDKGLEFQYVPSQKTAQANPFILMRVVSNLVSNAIKYTPSGKILLGTRRAGDILRVEVHDTGIGLSAAQFETARGRNVRLENDNIDVEGEGFGLAIATELAREQGWTLRHLPGRTTGTSIALEIPLGEI